jgi:hypothetical protein
MEGGTTVERRMGKLVQVWMSEGGGDDCKARHGSILITIKVSVYLKSITSCSIVFGVI